MVHFCGTNCFNKVGVVRDGTGGEGIVGVFELFEAEKVEQKGGVSYAVVVDGLGCRLKWNSIASSGVLIKLKHSFR